MTFLLPIRLLSEANRRGHWAKHSGRIASQRLIAKQEMRVHCVRSPRWCACCGPQATVTLTRVIGPRGKAFDSDGMVCAAKAIRDGIADALGINDGSDAVTWRYGQRRGDEHGVEVKVEAR